MRGDPPVIVLDLIGLLANDSIRVRRHSPEEGYVESDWFDVRRADVSGPTPYGPQVKFRFWVDPIGNDMAQIVGEVVGIHTLDPSLPERQREVLLPREHVGRVMLARVLDAVSARFQ